MDSQEARKILALFRPGSADEKDPWFQQARQLAQTDPELGQWFSSHCESYLSLRQKLQAIPVPPGLKEQILSERKIQRTLFQKYWPRLLAAAALAAMLAVLAYDILPFHAADHFAAYRKRMTESALRSYSMDLMTSDPGRIREFLKQKDAPADYSLPSALEKAEAVGCVVSHWQGSPVSMICFKSGRPLPPGEQSDLWLFVIDRQAASNSPAPSSPVFARVNKATTASWSDDNKSYLLATVGEEAFLQKYLQ